MLFQNALGQASLAVYLAVTVLRILKTSGAQLLLEGLHVFYSLDPAEQVEANAKPQAGQTSKERRLAAKQLDELKSKGHQVARMPLKGRWLGIPGSIEDLDYMVTAGLAMILTAAAAVAICTFTNTSSSLAVFMAFFGLFMPIHVMVKFDIIEEHDWATRFVFFLVMAIGTAASHAVLAQWSLFKHLTDFGVVRATAGFDAAVNSLGEFLVRKKLFEPPYVPVSSDPWYLALLASIWAGVLAASLLTPGIRFASMLYRAAHAPSWAEGYIGYSWTKIKAMQIGFVVPLLLVLVQFEPLASLWGLTPHTASLAFLAFLSLMAVTHIFSVRQLSQAHLDGGILEWYKHVHSGKEFEGKMQAIKTRLLIIKVAVGKSATQLAVPALVSLAAFCVLFTQAVERELAAGLGGANEKSGVEGSGLEGEASDGVLSGGVESEAQGQSAGSGGGNIKDLYEFVFKYLSWWCALVWCVGAYGTMAICRLGLNSGVN